LSKVKRPTQWWSLHYADGILLLRIDIITYNRCNFRNFVIKETSCKSMPWICYWSIFDTFTW
jgi:hypothetical protein